MGQPAGRSEISIFLEKTRERISTWHGGKVLLGWAVVLVPFCIGYLADGRYFFDSILDGDDDTILYTFWGLVGGGILLAVTWSWLSSKEKRS